MKKEKKEYLINNTPVTWTELIKKAEEYGYEGEGGVKYTSGAAQVLRNHGFKVKPKTQK